MVLGGWVELYEGEAEMALETKLAGLKLQLRH